MKFVFNSYITNRGFSQPAEWLNRISLYTGILEELSINNKVISIEQIDYEGDYHKAGVDYKFVKVSKLGRYLPFQRHLFIKRQNPDVVFIQSLHFPLQIILLRLSIGKKVKIIIQNHAEQPFRGVKKRLCYLADKFVDAYLFASKAMGYHWVERKNLRSPNKIYEVMEVSSIFHPIDKTAAQTQTSIDAAPVFLWVGRLNNNKNPINVIRAFLKYVNLIPSARLYMIYHTSELIDEINELLSEAPKASQIQLVGEIPHSELLYWYNSADFIISGSYYEGSGTAVCEAMSCGCIPVVTDIPSFKMMTDNGNCGLLYEPGNETALLQALLKTHQISLAKMREKVLSYFKSNLSFEAIAKKIHQIAASL